MQRRPPQSWQISHASAYVFFAWQPGDPPEPSFLQQRTPSLLPCVLSVPTLVVAVFSRHSFGLFVPKLIGFPTTTVYQTCVGV